jgi:hypothetical protein
MTPLRLTAAMSASGAREGGPGEVGTRRVYGGARVPRATIDLQGAGPRLALWLGMKLPSPSLLGALTSAVLMSALIAACDYVPLGPGDPSVGRDGGTAGATGNAGAKGAAGTTGIAGTTGAAGASAPPQPTVPLPAGVVPLAYVDVTKVAADCAAPDGRPYEPASAAEVASLLVGKWRHCSGSTTFPIVQPGIEFARDRAWRALAPQGAQLIPAAGFDTEGSWYMAAEDPKDMVVSLINVVRIHLKGEYGASGYPVTFLQNPTRMRIAGDVVYAWQGE